MKFFILLSLFSLVGAYTVETVDTPCLFVPTRTCNEWHSKEIEIAINKRPGQYISHSTTSTKYGMHSLIVYK